MNKQNDIEQYYAQCLRANLPAALRVLMSAPSPSPRARALRKKVEARFGKKGSLGASCSDELVAGVITAYRQYYREALLSPRKARGREVALEKRVRALASDFGIQRAARMKRENLERALDKEFRRRGYFCLFGRVAPFRSLLVWRSQRERRFRVKLGGGVESVKVVLLDGFVELGWLHFATFGRYHVGGWAKRDGLFCVAKAYQYDFRGEAFRVSYLTHEAQHFSDYKKFPGLPAADLEFRAKLAELSFLKRPAKLLEKLRAEAKNDPSLPHSFAAFRILRELGELRAAKLVRARARAILAEHSKTLAGSGNFSKRAFR